MLARLLEGTSLSGAIMTAANLGGTDLSGANLSRADLTEADFSDADLRKCKGLTQEQIDQAVVQNGWPPNLEGVVDTNTGKPLVWSGRSLTVQEDSK